LIVLIDTALEVLFVFEQGHLQVVEELSGGAVTAVEVLADRVFEALKALGFVLGWDHGAL